MKAAYLKERRLTMKTEKMSLLFIGAMLLVLTGLSTESYARVDIDIGINLPLFRFSAPPELVVIPGTYVYYVPGAEVDVLFYHGYWYRPYEGRWFRASSYNGPWRYIRERQVPGEVIGLPPDYRNIPPGHRRIPYRDFNRNWRRWERDRYWDRDENWRGGRGEGRREEKREERHEERERERY